mgnify:CR=1 FL=1
MLTTIKKNSKGDLVRVAQYLIGSETAVTSAGNFTDAFATDVDDYAEFSLDDVLGPQGNHFRYVFGVARELMAAGVAVEGFDTVYAGDVPLGAGMSSSAALESCFAFALISFVISYKASGFCPKAIPPCFTLGHDTLISIISIG